MSTLRLGAYKLPAAEVVLIQTLFRLYSHGNSFRWTFVTSPPYDAVLVDSTSPSANDPEVSTMAKAVLRLTRMNEATAPNTLARPIRADKLQDWLKSIESEIDAEKRPFSKTLISQEQTVGYGTSPAPAQAQSPFEDKQSAQNAVNASKNDTVRFKLRRWPPATLLRADPNRIRMATLLSRRAMNATELSEISQQPFAACQSFLQTLQTTGLVSIEQPQPVAVKTEKVAAAPKPTFARGLISGIRRRLGL